MNLFCSLYRQIICLRVSYVRGNKNSFNRPMCDFIPETQGFLKVLYSNHESRSLYCCPTGLKITLNIFIKILGYKQLLPLMKNYIAHISISRTLLILGLFFFPNEKEDSFLFIIERTRTIAKDTCGK